MAPMCDCGETVGTDEDVFRCAADNHRRALIAQARRSLEDTSEPNRDDGFWEAMAELDALEKQAPPRPPDAAEVIDLITVLEQNAADIEAVSGARPTTMLVEAEMGEQIARVALAYPGVFNIKRPAHERPASIQAPGSTWIGRLSGIDLYVVAVAVGG